MRWEFVSTDKKFKAQACSGSTMWSKPSKETLSNELEICLLLISHQKSSVFWGMWEIQEVEPRHITVRKHREDRGSVTVGSKAIQTTSLQVSLLSFS